jgi:hypothetical protein
MMAPSIQHKHQASSGITAQFRDFAHFSSSMAPEFCAFQRKIHPHANESMSRQMMGASGKTMEGVVRDLRSLGKGLLT